MLIRSGVQVTVFNQRSVDEIFSMLYQVAAMVGQAEQGMQRLQHMRAQLDAIQQTAATFKRRPKVYFEEWDEPHISGIRWVSELMGIAGGDDVFPELAVQSLGAVPIPLYQDAAGAECVFPINNAEVRFAFAEDQEQVDKLLEVRESCPQLQHIYFDDPRGLRKYDEPGLASLDALIETGAARARKTAEQYLNLLPLAPFTARSDAHGHFTLSHDLKEARIVAAAFSARD